MIVVRTVLQGKFGQGGLLAAGVTEGMEVFATALGADTPRWRVLTDLSGAFDTVTLEVEVETLTEWEALRVRMFELPEFATFMAETADLTMSGKQDYLNVEAQG